MIAGIIGLIVGVAIYFLYVRVFASRYTMNSAHTQNALEQIQQESENSSRRVNETDETLAVLKADIDQSPTLKTLSYMPMGKNLVVRLVKAGKHESAGIFVLTIVILMLAGILAISFFNLSPLLIFVAIAVPLLIGRSIIQGAIDKRNTAFINMFPDVLDMIVRSVKSGFPINTAVTMVAENMEDPVKSEFRQLGDELALGRPLNEALNRLATRIDEQDLRFFVVVLKIQQETGGNLAEVITNLSNIIRKRKQLRHKIRAMTSEGRATGYILGALPFVLFGALLYSSPEHLDPLFDSTTGNMVLAAALGCIIMSQVIVRKMIDIDI